MTALSGTDLLRLGLWLGILAGGLGVCLLLHRRGLATTYVRDLLHIGAGIWVFGWTSWEDPLLPLALVAAVAAATALTPTLAGRLPALQRASRAFADGDERWTGLTAYTAAYAALTALGLLTRPLPAMAAALCLSWGDGLGGFAGRRWGRRRFQAPRAKAKSLEGSLVVALAGFGGVLVAAWWLGAALPLGWAAAAGVVAAAVEALSPRSLDNLLVPAAVWGLLFYWGTG